MKKTIAGGVWPVMITPFTEDKKIDMMQFSESLSGMIRTGLTEFLRYASQVKCLS